MTIIAASGFAPSTRCGVTTSCRSRCSSSIAASSSRIAFRYMRSATVVRGLFNFLRTFSTTAQLTPPAANSDVGFAGFRLHALINRKDYYDEVGVFLGASYFRAVAKGQVYGLSARGLSIRTADPKGEEFPAFKTFWIEKPTAAFQLDCRARAARQPERGGRLSFHHPSGRNHHLRYRNGALSPHRYCRSRCRFGDQHVLFRRQRPDRGRRLSSRRARFRMAWRCAMAVARSCGGR